MYKFLRFTGYTHYTAPELDANGKVVRNRNGSAVYLTVSRQECFRIAGIMSDGKPYSLPWYYDIDGCTLLLIDPADPSVKTHANRSADNVKKMDGLIAAERQCVQFGECDKELDICYDCPDYDTDKCRKCKRRCEQCQQKVCRVISYDAVSRNDGVEDMTSKLDPADPSDLMQTVEDKEILAVLQKAVSGLDGTDKKIIKTLYDQDGAFRKAQEECGFKSVNSVQKRHAKILKTLGDDKKLKSFLNNGVQNRDLHPLE